MGRWDAVIRDLQTWAHHLGSEMQGLGGGFGGFGSFGGGLVEVRWLIWDWNDLEGGASLCCSVCSMCLGVA